MTQHTPGMDNEGLSVPLRIHDALSKADLEYSAYSCNGVNIFGDRKSVQAANRAFHSHGQIDDLQRNLRHWRDECGKLHAQLKTWQDVARRAGICMACAIRAPEPYGCTDCLNTGWDGGAPNGFVKAEGE